MVAVRKNLLLVLMLTLCFSSALAYAPQFASDGVHILKWKGKVIRIGVSDSLRTAPNIRRSEPVAEIVRRSFRRWERYSGIRIDLVATDARTVSGSAGKRDGISLLSIAQTSENLLLFSGKKMGQSAVTRLFYDEKGRIIEADIILNPMFLFSSDGTPGSFDLESTLVHEAGHLLGLGHSSVTGATMNGRTAKNGLFGMPFTSARTLSEDDRAGIRYLYGYNDRKGLCCARISGRLRVPGSRKTGRIQVWAEEASTGRVAAGVISDRDGAFVLGGVRKAAYRLFAKSFPDGSAVVDLGLFDLRNKRELLIRRTIRIVPAGHRMSLIGFNGQLSGLAVPLNSGRSYMVYVGGYGLEAKKVTPTFRSRFLTVDNETISVLDYGGGLSVLSFVVHVRKDAPLGEYTVRLSGKSGLSSAVVGGLTIESATNPWIVALF